MHTRRITFAQFPETVVSDNGQCFVSAEFEEFLSHRLSSRLDLMVPSVSRRVQRSQSQQKVTHDFHASDCEIAEGDRVYARNFAPRAGAKWLPGEVVQKTGPLSCQVQLQDGTVWKRHQEHIRRRFTEQSEEVATPLETVPQEES